MDSNPQPPAFKAAQLVGFKSHKLCKAKRLISPDTQTNYFHVLCPMMGRVSTIYIYYIIIIIILYMYITIIKLELLYNYI